MEPIEMPKNWLAQFVGVTVYTEHKFRVSKAAITDNIVQLATYIIDMGDGTLVKSRDGLVGSVDNDGWECAKTWPILHDHLFGMYGEFMRGEFLVQSTSRMRRGSSAYNRVYNGTGEVVTTTSSSVTYDYGEVIPITLGFYGTS